MGALGFSIGIDTTGADGPALTIDGEQIPLLEFGYQQGPDVARWSFVVPVAPLGDDGGLAGLLATVDPAELEAAALDRDGDFAGQAAPFTQAILATLKAMLR